MVCTGGGMNRTTSGSPDTPLALQRHPRGHSSHKPTLAPVTRTGNTMGRFGAFFSLYPDGQRPGLSEREPAHRPSAHVTRRAASSSQSLRRVARSPSQSETLGTLWKIGFSS